jgi:hypothetical protein
MTVYELAAFPILISAAIAAVIPISEDVKSPTISVVSAATLCERCGSCQANDRYTQSKSD